MDELEFGPSNDWPVAAVAAFIGCCIVAVLIVVGLGFATRFVWFAALDWWHSL